MRRFSPDVIGKDASYCLVMQLVEIGVLAACLYLLNSSIAFWDLVSFSGYKYIPLVINTIVYQLLGPIAYYVVLLYTGIAVSFFTVRSSVCLSAVSSALSTDTVCSPPTSSTA